ncbi:MAG: MFS transporter [Elusimicrobiota bacterium]|jgi:predicted MFS family arabinose efflux permease|nr:MFS transporter [Elusimicrobiota bacterium]
MKAVKKFRFEPFRRLSLFLQRTFESRKTPLWTKNFVFINISNFLLFFSFYLLMPTLPFYLADVFAIPNAQAGLVIAVYVLASTIIKPLTAFIADAFDRKTIYVFLFFMFIALFAAYIAAATLSLFVIARILQGFAFGALMTTSNALVIDIIPKRRQGEGIGYFGLSSTLAMSMGPLIGLLIYDYFDYHYIFYGALIFGTIGGVFAILIKSPASEKSRKDAINLDRFLSTKGLTIGFNFVFLGMAYATMTTYIAMYGKELKVWGSAGMFFIILSIGLIISRLFSGKNIDKGKVLEMIKMGNIFAVFSFFLLFFADKTPHSQSLIYYISALTIGLSYGMMFPSFNVMFINLAPHNRRAAASSTYLTSWDLGIGLGIVFGGEIIDAMGISSIYAFAGLSTMIALLYFVSISSGYFTKNRLR